MGAGWFAAAQSGGGRATTRRTRTLPLVFFLMAPVTVFAEPLVLAPGKSVELSCTTQAVVMLPAAAGSGGKVVLRLELREPAVDRAGTWSVEDAGAAHGSSFGARDKARCAAGCALSVPATGRIELWSPKRAGAGTLPEGEALTVIAIDPVTLKLNATTVLGKEIAAFEQGTCDVR